MTSIIQRNFIFILLVGSMIVSPKLFIAGARLKTASVARRHLGIIESTLVKKPCDGKDNGKTTSKTSKTKCEGGDCTDKVKISKKKEPEKSTGKKGSKKPYKTKKTTKTTSTNGKVPSPQPSLPTDPSCTGESCPTPASSLKIKIPTEKLKKGKKPEKPTGKGDPKKPCKTDRSTKTTSTSGKVPSPKPSVPNDPKCTGKSCPTPASSLKIKISTEKLKKRKKPEKPIEKGDPKKPCKTDKTTKTTSTSGKVPSPKPSLPKEPSCNGKSCSKPTPESSIPKNVPTPASSVSKEQSKDSSKTKDGEAYKVTTKTSCSSISSIVWAVQFSAFVSLLSYIA